MQVDNKTIHVPIHDVWDMEATFDNEVKRSFSGSKTRTITEVLVGCKKYMEGEKQKWLTSHPAQDLTVK